MSFHSSYGMGRWMPAGAKRNYRNERPEVGSVVAYDRGAYLVTHIADAEPQEKDTPGNVPYVLTLRRLHGPASEYENDIQDRGVRIRGGAYRVWDTYEEGRVPLCSCCGHPWPCLNFDATVEAQKTAEVMDKKLAKAGVPGTCYACGEPITTRQVSVTYPEDNIELIGYPGPRFHTRQACAGGWYEYERKRQQVLPDVEPVYAPAQSATLWSDR